MMILFCREMLIWSELQQIGHQGHQEPTSVEAIHVASRCGCFHGRTVHFMRIIVFSIAFVLLIAGCSKKETATAVLHIDLARGDLASPAEVTTYTNGSQILYCVPINLSTAKAAVLRQFAQKHPKGQLEIKVGSKVIFKSRMPAHVDATTTFGLSIACDTVAEAKGIADSLRELSY